jgi:zinc transporter ZupT
VAFHRAPDRIEVTVRNVGPEPVRIGVVQVNDAIWKFSITPKSELGRLEPARITIPYPWETGDPHAIAIITGTGLKFTHEVGIANESPVPDARTLGTFALLGLYVGVIPVYLGLLWFPFLRRLSPHWMTFLLSLTAGLLIFLAVGALKEALEIAERLPAVFQGTGLLTIGFLVSLLGLMALGQRARETARSRGEVFQRLTLAYMIASGIGLHNLGEGLAIGSAYALGEVALGALLVIGFMIHNTTEGFAIVAPVSHDRFRLSHLFWMGFIAGVPTIVGAWIGGLTYSDPWAVLFLAVGAGAILQVVLQIITVIARDGVQKLMSFESLAGLAAGLLIMYTTGLLVAV